MDGRIKIKKIINICLYSMIFLFVITAVSAATTRLWINPVNSYGGVGSTFTKDVVISDVTDLYAYEFKISWNPNVLSCTNVAPYPPPSWKTYFLPVDQFDNNQGYYRGARAAYNPAQGFSNIGGSYTLLTLTFTVISTGTSSFDISQDMLLNSTPIPNDPYKLTYPIYHTVSSGYYYGTSSTSSTTTTRQTTSTSTSTTTTTRQTTSTTTSTSTTTTTPSGCPSGQICCSDMSDCSDPLCLSGTSQGQCSSVYRYYSCNNCRSSTTSTTTTRQTTSTTTTIAPVCCCGEPDFTCCIDNCWTQAPPCNTMNSHVSNMACCLSTPCSTSTSTSTSTTTTTRQTTSTSTSTTTISGFTGTNFVCNYMPTNNLWECSLDYSNNMNQRVIVKFHFIDSVSSEVKSTGSIWADMGSSGTAGSELSCSNYHGTYYVVWRVFKDSDRMNAVGWSMSPLTITCS